MESLIRLRDLVTNTYFIADIEERKVYGDKEDRGSIGRCDKVVDQSLVDRVLESAQLYEEYFERAIPGNATPDGRFEVRGPLTRNEQRALEKGDSVPNERPARLLHLDFFDENLDGTITFGENYRGWRRLGFGRIASLWKAILSAILFAWRHGQRAIHVARFEQKGYRGGSGIYDEHGRVDLERLREYLEAFGANGKPLAFDEVSALLEEKLARGGVSRRQFRSLFSVCERLNKGERVVTCAQFCGLFDGSLLWLVASTTDNAGRRPKWSTAWNVRAARR